jgi:acetolactate synthase I/III small subunit
VKKVVNMTDDRHIERELCVLTVQAPTDRARQELQRVISLCGARVVAYSQTAFTIEVIGTSVEVDEFLELVRPLGIRDMVRSAPVAIQRPGVETPSDSIPPPTAARP